jgi:hypothetical protein
MSKRTASRMILPLLLALAVGSALANPAALYQAETEVADEGSAARNAALSQMLTGVLLRVTGNTAIAGQAGAQEVIAAAPSLVEQYRYRAVERDGAVVRLLWARFDRAAVERMLRERGIAVWNQRPRVLLWLATEQGAQRRLLRIEEAPDARAALLARAAERGMPLQLPLLDLEDQGRLTPADLWSDYQAAIRAASERYPHDQVLTGRLRALSGGRWSGTWTLAGRDGPGQSFETAPLPLAQALAAGVDRAQDLLAARFAPVAGGVAAGGTAVRFVGVGDLDAYGSLVRLLESLDGVAAIALARIEGDEYTFLLTPSGGPENLERALGASGILFADPVPPAPPAWQTDPAAPAQAPEPQLVYRLRP